MNISNNYTRIIIIIYTFVYKAIKSYTMEMSYGFKNLTYLIQCIVTESLGADFTKSYRMGCASSDVSKFHLGIQGYKPGDL